jgi:hypothetical protein
MFPCIPSRNRAHAILFTGLVLALSLAAGVGLAVNKEAVAGPPICSAKAAAIEAATAGTWVMVDYNGASPVADILRAVNVEAEFHCVLDTNGVPGDPINDNVLAYYVDLDGNCLYLGQECWELHQGPDIIPGNAHGLEVVVSMADANPFPYPGATPTPGRGASIQSVTVISATTVYVPDGGLLPIAANEYWMGSQGSCPYSNCGEPYSFVRDPFELPPFYENPPGSDQWARNYCPDPYNDNLCQGPYDGYGENYGRAFALMGADAKPNYGSSDPRGAVELDYRYDALVDGGSWNALIANDTWIHDVPPIADGAGRAAMEAVLMAGGYAKVPILRSVHEPPPVHIGEWSYCWDTPGLHNCFNFPESNRPQPYDALQFLSGVSGASLAQAMYDDGNYVEGRYAPGQPVLVLVYNSVACDQWGYGGNKADAAVVVGYFGAIIVGYGSDFQVPCNCSPGDWGCYAGCVQGNANTVYGLVGSNSDLVIDPSRLLEEFLPKKVILLRVED